MLNNKREERDLDHFNDFKAFTEYSNDIDDIYKNIEGYNSIKICKYIDCVFDCMIADMLSNKKIDQIISELFIRGRKVNICLVLIMEPYFPVSKNIWQVSLRSFNIKFPSKQDIQQILFNH